MTLDRQPASRIPIRRRRWVTYAEALVRHPDARVELAYRTIDESYPDAASAPVATAPAVFVWRDAPATGEPSRCIAVYWLRDED